MKNLKFADCIRLQVVREREVQYTTSTPNQAASVIRECIAGCNREEVWAAYLDTKNRVVGARLISAGTLNECGVNIQEIFRAALVLNSAGVVIGHNHPSGDPEPSAQDRSVCRRIEAAAKTVDVPILDFIVVTDDEKFVSFRERGWLGA